MQVWRYQDDKNGKKDLDPEKIWEPPEEDKHLEKKVQRAARRAKGALTLHLFFHCTERMSLGRPRKIRDATKVDLPFYFSTKSPVKGPRDEPEAAALAQALQALVQEEPERAADIISTRLLALEIQTQPGQDWQKATKWESRVRGTKTLAGHPI